MKDKKPGNNPGFFIYKPSNDFMGEHREKMPQSGLRTRNGLMSATRSIMAGFIFNATCLFLNKYIYLRSGNHADRLAGRCG